MNPASIIVTVLTEERKTVNKMYRAAFRFVLYFALAVFLAAAALSQPLMYAHYINVGQGDATLLEFPCGAVLIDTGAQDQAYVDSLLEYLDTFFARRTDLNKSLALVIVTHDHPDHTKGLREVIERFTVHRYVDNGQLASLSDTRWVRDNFNTGGRQIVIREVADDEITALPEKTGLTDPVIDPIVCGDCDPVIRILSGRIDVNPGWSLDAFDNKNNHSLVVRVDFGESSFLFTGDLEKDAIETMLAWYEDTDMLDVDVYQVGHHGSNNGTTAPLLEAMTPELAVISCGPWTFGQNNNNNFTTYAYGHPRKDALDLLSAVITKRRSQPIKVKAAMASRDFRDYTVRKKIYCTAWDGNIKLKADLSGSMVVSRNN